MADSLSMTSEIDGLGIATLKKKKKWLRKLKF